MTQLNYNHLYYFYVIAREGSIASAARVLHLTPQTMSGQLCAFEDYLGVKLFERKGRRLILSETGKLTHQYAEDIFNLGHELRQALSNQESGEAKPLRVGVTDAIPKVFTFDLLKTCLEMELPIKLYCHEGCFDNLLSDLALNKLDVVVADRQLYPESSIKAYSHFLGESGMTFYAESGWAKELTEGFPQSLDQQPILMCGDKSNQKQNLKAWFKELAIRPNIVAEFDDSALMKFFGQHNYGVFCTPSIIEEHVVEQYHVAVIGRTDLITERFYALCPERKRQHPGVNMLVSHGKSLFGEPLKLARIAV